MKNYYISSQEQKTIVNEIIPMMRHLQIFISYANYLWGKTIIGQVELWYVYSLAGKSPVLRLPCDLTR